MFAIDQLLWFCYRDLTALLKSRDVSVFLISGGFHSIVDHVAKELGVPLGRVFANRLLHSDQGRFGTFDEILNI